MEEEFELCEGVKIPVIYVTRDKYTGFCSFWCKYCNKLHHHGQGDGHRVAHCDKNSPYHDKGYILKTREDILSLIEVNQYIVNLFKFNDNKRISIALSKNNLMNFDRKIGEKLIKAYLDKDYLGTTHYSLLLFGKIKEDLDNGYLIDLQGEGDGTPDFMYNYRGNPSFKDFYIEFKSESDNLRLNQLYSFINLTKNFEVYLLSIEKKRY